MKRLLLFSILSILCLTISAQTNTWNGNNGSWSTAAFWSLNHAPNINEDVIIPTGSTVYLDVDGFAKSITLQGNAIFNFTNNSGLDLTFTNASSFSAGSTFNWLMGTIKGGGSLTLNGTTILTTNADPSQHRFVDENTTINNNGTMLYQGNADFYLLDGTLNNNSSGIIDLQTAGGSITYSNNSGVHLFNNQGLLKRTGTGEVWVTAEFHNNGGTISVEGGNLVFNYLSKYLTNGTYNVSPGSELTFLTPADHETVLSGTLTGVLNGDLNWKCKFSVPNSATFNFTGNNGVNWSDYGILMSGGTLTNLGDITVTGDGSKYINDQSTLNNEGTMRFQGTGEFYINHGTMNNQSTGIMDIQSPYAYFSYGNGATHILHNYGLIKNTIATGTQTIEVELQNHNGTISVENGTLYLYGLSKYLTDGTYNVSPGARLYWNTEVVCEGTLSGVLDGELYCSNASTKIAPGKTAIFDFTGSTGVIWQNLDITGSGTLINRSEITLNGGANKFLKQNTTLNNEGIMNFEEPGNLYVENGTINNQSSGIMDLQVGNIYLSGTGALNNNGLLRRTTSTGIFAINVPTTNTGTINAMMGTLEFDGNLNNTVNGIIKGGATLDVPPAVDFTNDGIFSPGESAGTLTILGDFESTPSSVLKVDINGTSQGVDYDLLAISGNAIMDGDIDVKMGFVANVDDEFVIVTSPNITSCNLPATVTGSYNFMQHTFDVICNPTNVTLKVTNIVLGTEDFTLNNISMYPNPSTGHFTIDLGREYTDVNVQITNMLGQLISSEKYASAKSIEKEITGGAGIYFVRVSTAKEGSNTLRIIKQ